MRRAIIVILFVFIGHFTFSQAWMQYLPQQKNLKELTFFDYQNAFNTWCELEKIDNQGYHHVDGKKIKAGGWKQFKRWEYDMRGLYDLKTGEIRSINSYDEWERMKKNIQVTDNVQGDWTQVGYNYSGGGYDGIGRLNTIAFHPTNEDVFWVGSAWGGLWKTEDHGDTWVPLSDNIGQTSIGAIAIPSDYETSHTILIGTGDRAHWSTRSVGILKSTDGGQTWTTTDLGFSSPELYFVGKLLIHPDDDDIIYAATSAGVYKTTDRGDNWEALYEEEGFNGIDMEFHPTNPSIIYVSTRGDEDGYTKIHRSLDGGLTWQMNQFRVEGSRTEIAVSPDEPNWLYVLSAQHNRQMQGVYLSDTQGQAGTYLNLIDGSDPANNLLNGDCVPYNFYGGQGEYDLCLVVNPLNANEVMFGGVNIWKSYDAGETWEITTTWDGACGGIQTVHADHHWLEFRHDSDTLFNCNDGGIYFSTDFGETWTDLSNGLYVNQIYFISNAQDSYSDALFGTQDNGTRSWYAGTFSAVSGGDGAQCLISKVNSDDQYLQNNGPHLKFTTDHWSTDYQVVIAGDSANYSYKSFALSPPSTVYLGLTDLWKSTDKGYTFTRLYDCSWDRGIRIISIAPSDPNTIYIVSHNNFDKSNDGGLTWTNLAPYTPFSFWQLGDLEVKETDPDVLWITDSGWEDEHECVYRSDDGGLTWEDISTGLPETQYVSILQNDEATGYEELYVCGYFGVFVKVGDSPWMPFSNGLPNVKCNDMDIYYGASNPLIRVGTFGRGLWESPVYGSDASNGTWLGTQDDNWHNAANWANSYIPTINTNVSIPVTSPHFPKITYAMGVCNNLEILSGASLTVNQNYLTVDENLTIYGSLIMTGTGSEIAVSGNVTWEAGSSVTATGTNNKIYVDGDWSLKPMATVHLDNVLVQFSGMKFSKILCSATGSYFDDLSLQKNNLTYNCRVLSTSTAAIAVKGDLTIGSLTKFYYDSDKTFYLLGNLNSTGFFYFRNGTFNAGSGTTLSVAHTTDYFNNLEIGYNTNCILNNDIQIRGNLYMGNGILDMNGNDIRIMGDIYKYEACTFIQDGGIIEFIGYDKQYLQTDLTLEGVDLNSTDTLVIKANKSVTFGQYDWTEGTLMIESGAVLNINDLVDDGMWGTFIVPGSTTLNITNPSGSVDLNGKLVISGGTVNVYGGNHASYWPSSADAEIHLNSGSLDFKNRGIYILDTPYHTLLDNITGGVIRTPYGFYGDHPAFNPSGGYIELYGSSLSELSHGAGSSFYKIIINKDPAAPRVKVLSNLDIDNNVSINSGELDINGYTVDVAGALEITGKLTMNNAASVLNVSGQVLWKPGSSANITDGLITFASSWNFQSGTNAILSGNNIAKAVGSSMTDIYHKDADASFANFVTDKTALPVYLDGGSSFPMRVSGSMTIGSGDQLRIDAADLIVNGTLTTDATSTAILQAGGSITATNSVINNTLNLVNGFNYNGTTMNLSGAVNLTTGGAVELQNLALSGTIDINSGSILIHNLFSQSINGHLVLDGGSFVIDKPYTGTMFGFAGTTDLNGGVFEISNEGIIFGTGATVNFNGGNLRIGGHFQATAASSFQPAAGAVEFINSAGSAINCINGNYFHQLILNKNAGATASTLFEDVLIQDDLVLLSGELQTQNNTLTAHGNLLIEPDGMLTAGSSEIYIGGSWTNNRGTSGFDEGTSSVTFDSPQPGIITPETFYNVDLDKPLPTGQYLSTPDNSTMTVLNKLTLGDGILLLGENATLNVNGNLHLKSGGGLNANPSSSNTIINLMGHWWDYNTLTTADQGFTPGNSTVNLIGTANQDIIAYSGVSFYDLTIQNPGHSIIPNNNVTVEDDFTILSGTWSPTATGLTFTFKGDFTIPDPSNWQDAVNTIMFSGTGQQNLTNTAGGWLYFGPVLVERSDLTESGTLNILTHLSCSDKLRVISGEVIFDEYRLYCIDSLVILPSGGLSMLNGSNIFMGDAAEIYVKGGTLNIWASASNRSTVTHMSSGHFSFLVENGGVIDATYTDFEYMGQRGLNLEGTGLFGGAQPLNHCAFHNGDAGSALLTINTTQEVTLYNVDFPSNTWLGTYNVDKSPTSGNVIMRYASGSFGGPYYEHDPLGLVHWPSCGVWEGDYSTEWHDRANWRFDYQYPDGGSEVVIPSGAPNYPVVSVGDAVIHSLVMGSSTSLIINQYGVYVSEYADIAGYLELAGANTILASDSLVWQHGSSAYMASDARIDLTGNMFIRHGSNLNLNAGTIYFIGNGESKLICHDTAQVYGLYNYKNSPYSLSLAGDTLARLTIKGYFRNGPNATLRCPSSQEWQFMSALVNTDNGHFRCENGCFRLKGNTGSLFRQNSGDYFNNLIIETPSKVSLYGVGAVDTLRIKGDLVINSPSTSGITANAFKILVWGDWINNVGTTAFNAGTSKVVFMDPTVPQAVQGSTNFYNLTAGDWETSAVNFYGTNTINNLFESVFTTNVYGTLNANQVISDNDFAFLNVYDGGAVTFSSFQQGAPVHVYEGTFTVTDLLEDYVKSSYTIDDGLISLGQTYSPTASHDLYYASITINGGELRFTGGNGDCDWPRSPGTASVTMSGGIFDMTNQGVLIKSTGFTENITGGMIRTYWGFNVDPAATNFHPTGGIVELYGTEECSFSMPEPNCWFYNLYLNKTDGGGAYPSSSMRVKNELRLRSGSYMETDGHTITVGP